MKRLVSTRRYSLVQLLVVTCVLLLGVWFTSRPIVPKAQADSKSTDYHSYESPQIHPLAITPDGTRLLATNSPANSLSIFQLSNGSPQLVSEIPVGLEPVSVAIRNNNEAWVANWLSDSISVVNLTTGNVIRTIDTGDEPTDIVFAGSPAKAYVCVAGLRQVKVYDPDNADADAKVIEIEGRQPRSLARDTSGERVFVSVFESGNQTTLVPASDVKLAGGLPAPNPALSPNLPAAPLAGLIVQRKGKKWADENGTTKWTKYIKYTLADNDLVVIDAAASDPKVVNSVQNIGTHIGNVLFDQATNRLMVVNTESHNIIRFEPKVRGRFISSRVSVVDLNDKKPKVTQVDLNPHINYDNKDGNEGERALSIGLPADIARDAQGNFYVAGTGSNRIAVLDNNGVIQSRINVGQGPTGLAIDNNQKLYAYNRFDETLSIIDLATKQELGRQPIGYNPEPKEVREGRRFLYDTSLSAHGDVSCASCHRNGHMDGLAWDLGDPTGKIDVVKSPLLTANGALITYNFHPMKGPMVTQSLKGIIGTEPFHWRGDRSKLADFNGAFVSLLGNPRLLTDQEMASFEAFIKTFTYPSNPLQNLDRSYSKIYTGGDAAMGETIYRTRTTDRGTFTCSFCHFAPPGVGTNTLIIPGQVLLMVNGQPEPQSIKVPQLRGMYQKIGFNNKPNTKQLAGFGFTHDGAIDNLLTFFRTPNFTFKNDTERLDLEAFVLSFDTGTAPIIGAQVTFNETNQQSSAALARLQLLMSQVVERNCDVIAKGIYQGKERGFLYIGNGMFQSDRTGDAPISWQDLVSSATKQAEITFTGVSLGTGQQLGIDRNLDGTLDGDK